MPNFAGARQTIYGNDHTKARKQAFALLPEWSNCVRCGRPMWKYETTTDRTGRVRSALHYDHTDDRRGYLGFSHARDNLHAGAVKGGKIAHARKRLRKQSRYW